MEEYNLNPYHNHTDSLANIPVTPLMIEHLRATKPWVRFISVMMFVLAGFMILAGIIIMFMPAMGTRGSGFGALVGIFYIVLSGLYVVPAFFLYQFASSIQDLLRGGGDVAMEAALGSQKSFWRFVGISTIIIMCIYALIFIFAIFFSTMTMFR